MSLEKLREEGLKWVELNKSKRFCGITKLLTDLYPDNAHFIYELLQNAEDAHDPDIEGSKGATHVTFELTSDCLIFEHNGDRLFSLKDVESITGIGDSAKIDDATTIGKFGIGFKAVFAYTDKPEIHSGDFHFRIHDLVVPDTNGVPRLDLGNNLTRFIFTLGTNKKSTVQAVKEIENGLCALNDSTLLFLNHIRRIDYQLPDGSGFIERKDHDEKHIEIRYCHPGNTESISHWLRFQKEVDILDDDDISRSCRIAIAYSLEPGDEKKDKSPWKIVPLKHGQVSIYFPAEKEFSNLRFHMHAPFASTVARDSVRACTANESLRDCVSNLIVESLTEIRELGMLTITFLAVLPNPNDNVPLFYEPIRKTIVNAFADEKLTPMKSGGHESSNGIFSGPVRISEVIDDNDLVVLLNDDDYFPPMWIANPPPQHQRVEHFIESLDIAEWGWEELSKSLDKNFCGEQNPKVHAWLANKSDDWLQKLYALLDTLLQERAYLPTKKSFWKIVRIASGEHVIGRGAFFPAGNNVVDEKFPRVKTELFKGNSKRQIEKAKSFLEQIGVSEVGEKQEIESILKEYYAENSLDPSEKQHLQHMQRFISWWEGNRSFDLFKYYYIFKNSDENYSKGSCVFIDQPYKDTGLKDFYTELDDDIVEIWSGYSKLKNFTAFAVAVGVKDRLNIIKTSIYKNPDWTSKLYASGKRTSYEVKDDYTIDGLDAFLQKTRKNISLLIWRTVANAPADVLKARYCPNLQTPYRFADSQLVHKLKKFAWIPAIDGKFYTPAGISQELLLPEFKNFFLNTNGWLNVIGFGESVKKQNDEYLKRKEYAERLGIPLAITELLNKLPVDKKTEFCHRLQSEIESFLNPPALDPLPSSPAPNPERREGKTLESASYAKDKEYEIKNRSVRTTNTPERKTYLKAHNSNEKGDVYCQLCDCKMPFKIKGEDHFEAVEFVRSSTKEHPENSVALCPNCAAEYKLACTTPEDERIDLVLSIDITSPEEEMKIPLELPNHACLRFTQKHLIDLRAAMLLHRESGSLEQEYDVEIDDQEYNDNIVIPSFSSPQPTSALIQIDSNLLKAISDKRVARSISTIQKLNTNDKSAVIHKIVEIIQHLVASRDFIDLMSKEGIHVTTLKMAVDYLIPGLSIQQFGFSKYPQFINHVCNDTQCAALYFKAPAEFRINKIGKNIPGYSKYDSTAPPSTTINVINNHPTTRKSIQAKPNVRVYVPSPPISRNSTINRCRHCGSPAMAGSDVCYTCG